MHVQQVLEQYRGAVGQSAYPLNTVVTVNIMLPL